MGSENEPTGLKGHNYGVSYNFGQITVGVDRKKTVGRYTTAAEVDDTSKQTSYGVAYAITPSLTVGASYAKNKTSDVNGALHNDIGTNDEKAKTIGYSRC